MHSVIASSTLWKEPLLKVYFMGDNPDKICGKWIYKGVPLEKWVIIDDIVNDREGWSMDGVENGKHVPRIKLARHVNEAHIRVQFKSKLTF